MSSSDELGRSLLSVNEPKTPPKISRIAPTDLEDSVHSLLDISAGSKNQVVEPAKTLKQTSSVLEYDPRDSSRNSTINPVQGASTFGSRLLTDKSKVNDFNAWDHVEWDSAHLALAESRVEFHKSNPVPPTETYKYNDSVAHSHWDDFYLNHDHKFFKDRKWINLEFPELFSLCMADSGPSVICDIGCAVGNTVYPLLRQNSNPQLLIHALDFSAEAIKVLKANEDYKKDTVNALVWDMADFSGIPCGITPGSVDVIVLIFAFSALSPPQWPQALENMKVMLRPGGQVLLRDYGRYDLTQLRLKTGRLLTENLYIRGDGTRVYYFTNEELANLFSEEAGWRITQNAIDKRLLVNRKEGKKMYRAWVQMKACKL